MKLKEVLENESNTIFKRYNELYPNDLVDIFEEIDEEKITNLDIMFNSLYSERTLSNTVMYYKSQNYDSCIDFICWLLHFSCLNRVLEIKELCNMEYDIGSRTETYTEKTKTNINSSNSSIMENIENTYGYDSSNPVPENKVNSNDTNESTQENYIDKEYKRIYTDKPMYELLDNEIKRRSETDFILLIFKVYTNILLLDIYE